MKLLIEVIFLLPLIVVPVGGYYYAKKKKTGFFTSVLMSSAIVSAYIVIAGYGFWKYIPHLPGIILDNGEVLALIILAISWLSTVTLSRLFPDFSKTSPWFDFVMGMFIDFIYLVMIVFVIQALLVLFVRGLKKGTGYFIKQK